MVAAKLCMFQHWAVSLKSMLYWNLGDGGWYPVIPGVPLGTWTWNLNWLDVKLIYLSMSYRPLLEQTAGNQSSNGRRKVTVVKVVAILYTILFEWLAIQLVALDCKTESNFPKLDGDFFLGIVCSLNLNHWTCGIVRVAYHQSWFSDSMSIAGSDWSPHCAL